MSLTNLSFIGIYFPLMLIAYYNPFFKSNTFRKFILVCASLGLYAFSEPVYISLLVCMILYNYCLVKLADKTEKKIFRIIAISLDVMVLLFFKYINAFLSCARIHNSVSNIAFPIGLSYFTFKAISYVVDSYDEKNGNLIDVAVYISNFLTLVSGPLSTYKDELSSIRVKSRATWNKTYQGLERFIIGFGKKVIIADSIGTLASQCFASTDLSAVMAWAGVVAYALQLFFDFSGYTDMAIGIGCLFGFSLPENFNYPYMATSVSDFWKKWHISLTKWFTKYIYIPLGGSRVKSTKRHVFNLFIVWLITGIWHGSSMTFIVWGMICFVFQLLEKYTKWADVLKKFHVGHIYTLLIFLIELVIFKSASLSSAATYIKSMFLLNGNCFVNSYDGLTVLKYLIPFISGIAFSTNGGVKAKKVMTENTLNNSIYNISLMIVFIVCILITMGRGYSAPLYVGF